MAKMEVDNARAECKAAASNIVEDIKLDFSEDIVALKYRCANITDTVWSLQTPRQQCFLSFRLTYKPVQLKWTTLAECNIDLTRKFNQLFTANVRHPLQSGKAIKLLQVRSDDCTRAAEMS